MSLFERADSHGVFFIIIAVLFVSIAVLNVLSWQRSRRIEGDLHVCVEEYRRLLEELPCPAR